MKKQEEIDEWKAKFKYLFCVYKREMKFLCNLLDEVADSFPETDKYITEQMEIRGQLMADENSFLREKTKKK